MPMDRSRYPTDWEAISKRIREREGNRCKFCGIENGSMGRRGRNGQWFEMDWINQQSVTTLLKLFGSVPNTPSRIVLTVAHLYDPDPMNCADDNLAALCQRCHLNHDRAQHARTRAENARIRAIRRGQRELPMA